MCVTLTVDSAHDCFRKLDMNTVETECNSYKINYCYYWCAFFHWPFWI